MLGETSTTLRPGSSPSGPRICKKLVLKGHASSTNATYTLFLKVQLPAGEQAEKYILLSDPNTQLQDAVVHRLDASGAAPALSTSAAAAASSLGIPLSIDQGLNDSFIDFAPATNKAGRATAELSDYSALPAVLRADDGAITLRSPLAHSPASKRHAGAQRSTQSYMVTLHLVTVPLSTPPLAPLSLRLPVPVCLNNFMRFTVDESIDAAFGRGGIDVEVDPPVLPVSAVRKSSPRRSLTGSSHRAASTLSYSEDEADVTLPGSASVDDSETEQDDTAIVGPFHACDALVIRIASQQAGDLVLPGPPLRSLPNALRLKHVDSSIAYQAPTTRLPTKTGEAGSHLGESNSEVNFEATLKLDEPFFPGLDREVLLYLLLPPSESCVNWRPIAVDASRGILSWSFGPTKSASSSPIRESNGIATEGMLTKSPTFEIGDLVVLPEPNQQAVAEEDQDLLKTEPPRGLDDADFDFSLDNAAAGPTKQRRFSLQSSASNRLSLSAPPSEHSEPNGNASNMLMIAFSLLPVLQSTEPVNVTVSGVLTLRGAAAEAPQAQDIDSLPQGFFVPAALAHDFNKPTVTRTTESPLQIPSQKHVSPQHAEQTLEDSRETVHHVQEDPDVSMRGLHQPHDGTTDEILRQALTIIAAHNESLSDVTQRLVPTSDKGSRSHSHFRDRRDTSRNDWIMRTSHLLWTLFLTAMILMLFNAGQNANRTLTAKIDQLSRIVEASVRVNPSSAVSSMHMPVPTPLTGQPDKAFDALELVAETISPPDEQHTSPSRVYGDNDHVTPEDEEVHPGIAEEGGRLTQHVAHWLHDLLRVPVLILQRLLSVLTGS